MPDTNREVTYLMSEDVLDEARAAGFEVVTSTAFVTLNPEAVRLLPSSSSALAVDVAGDYVMALTDSIPSPAEFHAIEKEAGMLLALSVATPEVMSELREKARSAVGPSGDAPASVGPVLAQAVERNASDVHLSVGQRPQLRVQGKLTDARGFGLLSAPDMEAAARWVAGTEFEGFNGDFDCAVTYAGSRWRVNLYNQRQSLALAIRRVPVEIPALDSLGLPPAVKNLARLGSGLVLFCGPTGSGKSTSLAALIDRINSTRDCHILTIEDPVEYVHTSRTAMVHQREVGDDTLSFATGLRSALRQDPDVILVGELRDLETMDMALTAAETGHLVFATVHASSAEEVFGRLINPFPAAQQNQVRDKLAAVMQAAVVQRLVRTTDGKRALACEVLLVNSAVKNLVRGGQTHQIPSVIDGGRGKGMVSMDYSLARLNAAGRITDEEAELNWNDPNAYAEHRSSLGPGAATAGFDDIDEFGDDL
jgi:twitching motility protein PilT